MNTINNIIYVELFDNNNRELRNNPSTRMFFRVRAHIYDYIEYQRVNKVILNDKLIPQIDWFSIVGEHYNVHNS